MKINAVHIRTLESTFEIESAVDQLLKEHGLFEEYGNASMNQAAYEISELGRRDSAEVCTILTQAARRWRELQRIEDEKPRAGG